MGRITNKLKKKLTKYSCICLLFSLFVSCNGDMQEVYWKMYQMGNMIEKKTHPKRWGYHALHHELEQVIRGFKTTDTIQQLLQEDLDPNYCKGEFGWFDSNPLMLVANSHYNTFERLHSGEAIPNPLPDTNVIHLLVKYGADINRRPYIWYIIHRLGSEDLNSLWEMRSEFTVNDEPDVLPSEEERYKASLVEDENRLLKAFLSNGANPDKLGHPYPFNSKIMAKITDEEANVCFAQGTRPINEAIEKGMNWESQVDLLLEYTTLDEESLKAAERSGDSEMVKKITKIWELQQKIK